MDNTKCIYYIRTKHNDTIMRMNLNCFWGQSIVEWKKGFSFSVRHTYTHSHIHIFELAVIYQASVDMASHRQPEITISSISDFIHVARINEVNYAGK